MSWRLSKFSGSRHFCKALYPKPYNPKPGGGSQITLSRHAGGGVLEHIDGPGFENYLFDSCSFQC